MNAEQKHNVWFAPSMIRAAGRALTEHATLGDLVEGAIIVALAEAKLVAATYAYVKLTREEMDVLCHVCAKAQAHATPRGWMNLGAEHRHYIRTLEMVIGQLAKDGDGSQDFT